MTLPTPLRASRIQALLGPSPSWREVRILGTVGSTSDLVRTCAERGAEPGLVIAAEGQTSGRGRRGTAWCSPSRRGVYASLLVKAPSTDEERLLFAPALGIAAARAIDQLGMAAAIKWPNDLVVAGRKVGGCLVDLMQAGRAALAVLGIGLNANFDHGDLVQDGALPAGSLCLLRGEPVDREALLASLLREVASALEELGSAPGDIVHEFRRRDALRGALVVAREGDRVVEGRALEADARLGLLIETPGGVVRLRPEHTHLLRARLAP